ncbi:hypothetical protein D3C84_663210 [compost metagenome]
MLRDLRHTVLDTCSLPNAVFRQCPQAGSTPVDKASRRTQRQQRLRSFYFLGISYALPIFWLQVAGLASPPLFLELLARQQRYPRRFFSLVLLLLLVQPFVLVQPPLLPPPPLSLQPQFVVELFLLPVLQRVVLHGPRLNEPWCCIPLQVCFSQSMLRVPLAALQLVLVLVLVLVLGF